MTTDDHTSCLLVSQIESVLVFAYILQLNQIWRSVVNILYILSIESFFFFHFTIAF